MEKAFVKLYCAEDNEVDSIELHGDIVELMTMTTFIINAVSKKSGTSIEELIDGIRKCLKEGAGKNVRIK